MLTRRQTHHNQEPPSDRIGRSKTERQQKRKVRSTKETRQKSNLETGTLSQDGGEEANESARRISGRQQRSLAETALWRKSDGGVRSREVKGEAVGQGQGKGVSDRDNLTDPGEAVTTSEVGGGINSKEEGEKGIRVERMDGQGVGRTLFKRGNRAPVTKVTHSRYRGGGTPPFTRE